jgi:hypothetical protein
MSEYRLSSSAALPGVTCVPGVSIWPARVYLLWPRALSSMVETLSKYELEALLSSYVRFLPNFGAGVLLLAEVLSESMELERL